MKTRRFLPTKSPSFIRVGESRGGFRCPYEPNDQEMSVQLLGFFKSSLLYQFLQVFNAELRLVTMVQYQRSKSLLDKSKKEPSDTSCRWALH